MIRVLAMALTAAFVSSCTSVQTRRPKVVRQRPPALTPSTPRSQAQTRMAGQGQITSPTAPTPVTAAPTAPTTASKIRDLEAAGDYVSALEMSVNASVSASTPQEQESYRVKSIEIVEGKLTPEQLDKVSRNSDFGYARGYALYRLGELAMEEHDKERAKKYFLSVSDFLPGSDLATRAREMVSQLESSRTVEAKTIGVVLPLTGKNAPVGQKALRGIEMGLGLNSPNSSFRLAVMDSEGNPDNARRGVERLVKEDNAIAIVGSLLSKTAPAVAAKADELGVPTIGLSQKAGLTEIGPNVFRNALTSEMQVRYLVRTAMEDFGMKRFAIVYPNDPYGVEYTNLFWDEVLARGGTIASVQSYNPKETDFRYVIQRLVGTFYVEGRYDEFKMRQHQKELAQAKKHSSRESNEEDILPPIVDFDAVFIPDSSKAMGQISAFLSFTGVKGVKLLGTNLWNSPGLAKRAGNFVNNLIFVDSYLPALSGDSRFVQEYKALYNEDPSLIEIQAYDSALILRQMIVQGATTRETLARQLTSLKRFPGALGTLNMNPDREIQRPLLALTLDKGEIVPLKIEK